MVASAGVSEFSWLVEMGLLLAGGGSLYLLYKYRNSFKA
jgi:LPXTG-motif cell wall-anchored protein